MLKIVLILLLVKGVPDAPPGNLDPGRPPPPGVSKFGNEGASVRPRPPPPKAS